jgi:hypothetical protein
MKAGVAFDICHEVYVTAREVVNSRMATLQMDRASKFLWRPDRRPRLVEYVSDFALAGSCALGEEDERPLSRRSPAALRVAHWEGVPPDAPGELTAAAAAADREARALTRKWELHRRRRELRASRLVLFRVYYLGGAEYHAARRLLGLSETSWSQWTDEIRTRVGRELLRRGMFPPARYFREMSTGK